MISDVLTKEMKWNEGDLRKKNIKFNIVEDKYFLVHAGLVVPTIGWPTEGNNPTTKTETKDPWVNGIMMIVIAYS